ncbi:MAG: Type II/IV secretion system ATP hydrolase TadA/VirB11/CpaF, TadA subfamily [uncultured Propionibacteriaceae bacterium]|uniref:Type II/IV secretion system ATP hydrolase TadA/VirB11/CpaF, TadA subfamily n=1 Tax=uncultured Propionibacteriaceae bacterium TaxID=257457 RepID=A0A6J4NA20_9ACTN|nr:MAG: Type II/IV secretion system ATP hydrolase TadA/VirB11/CpaF, TadA subfamily [uncultured Propionibacteriaceae bacterium]
MSLSDRLKAARDPGSQSPVGTPPASAPKVSGPPARSVPKVEVTPPVSRGAIPSASGNEALTKLKDRASAALFERLGARLNDTTLSEEKLHAMVRTELNRVVEDEKVPLSTGQRQRLIQNVEDDVLGHGPLQRLLDDPSVTEIMVNGPNMIYIEQHGKLTGAPVRFASEEALRRVIERIVSRVGRRIDESSPLVDARLQDGSRVNAVIPPLAFSGSTLTIRKFAKDPFKVNDLIAFGTLSSEMAELLRACVEARLNIIVSGGTGTGKTTLLNVLSSFIPEGERIVTIEDAVELQLQQEHLVRLESRPPNIEGKGEVGIRELVRNSLRMRPDRIVVGEVRGGESLDMLQAMNTGHDGSLSTVHANTPRDAIARLETLVLMAGMDLPLRAIREQIASAVDLIVQLNRLRDGTRKVTFVTEVQGMEGQTVTLQDAFLFDYSAGVDASGKFLGKPIPTGVRPRFADKFLELGITLSPRVFAPPPASRTSR